MVYKSDIVRQNINISETERDSLSETEIPDWNFRLQFDLNQITYVKLSYRPQARTKCRTMFNRKEVVLVFQAYYRK